MQRYLFTNCTQELGLLSHLESRGPPMAINRPFTRGCHIIWRNSRKRRRYRDTSVETLIYVGQGNERKRKARKRKRRHVLRAATILRGLN